LRPVQQAVRASKFPVCPIIQEVKHEGIDQDYASLVANSEKSLLG